MNILHVVPSYFPAVRYGGPIYSVHGLAKATAQLGHRVDVFTTNIDGPGTSNVPVDEAVELDGVHVRYFQSSRGRRLFRAPAMKAALDERIRTYDVVHVHSVFLWPTLIAARTASGVGIPYIVSPRGMLVPDLVRKKSRLAKLAWISLFERRTLADAAAVHVTSSMEGRELEKLGLQARRTIVVPNGIEMPPHETSGRTPQQRSRPYVLSLGRLNWKKGLDRLICAFRDVPDADLIIAGNDDEHLEPTLRKLAEREGLSARVMFAGPVYGAAKWDLLRGAAVFAMPSYSENFGNAALEAMACGVPVLVTPEVGLADSIIRTSAGVVCEGGAEELGRALRSLLEDEDRRHILGRSGRQAAALEFSWPAIARRFEALYEDVRVTPNA